MSLTSLAIGLSPDFCLFTFYFCLLRALRFHTSSTLPTSACKVYAQYGSGGADSRRILAGRVGFQSPSAQSCPRVRLRRSRAIAIQLRRPAQRRPNVRPPDTIDRQNILASHLRERSARARNRNRVEARTQRQTQTLCAI